MSDRQTERRGQQRVTLDVDVGAEPLRGVLHADGNSQPFEGWLALVSALARLVDGGPQQGLAQTSAAAGSPIETEGHDDF